MRKKRVLVFGVFDFLHPGHIAFLKQARKHGQELIVVVAHDSVVRKLKKREPQYSERERTTALRRLAFVSAAILGDRRQGTYQIIKKLKPDMICVGYDQDKLKKDLLSKMSAGLIQKIPITKMRPHAPHIYRSSFFRRRADRA